jgi:hypothetical protein
MPGPDASAGALVAPGGVDEMSKQERPVDAAVGAMVELRMPLHAEQERLFARTHGLDDAVFDAGGLHDETVADACDRLPVRRTDEAPGGGVEPRQQAAVAERHGVLVRRVGGRVAVPSCLDRIEIAQ